MATDKVFGSDITRTHNVLKNNLYDILTVDHVTPLPVNNTKDLSCDFTPKTDKYFVPKKKLRLKVKTVRDIRNLFEKDIYTTLESDLEKQQNMLLRKIRGGSSKDEKTKQLATNILKSEKPISRVAWQMVINVNPDEHPHASQYVLWNGKCIQVNGSKGGKNKFICKYDLGAQRMSFIKKSMLKKSNTPKMKSLLRNSMTVKFKPGPLSRKKQLDISHQKYNVGGVQLTMLPNPGLDIIPEYGKPLESSITNYLHNLRDVNGIISDKWAEFAVSTLGREENGCAVHLNRDSSITFDLKYKYEQRQLLMRHCDEKISCVGLKPSLTSSTISKSSTESVDTLKEVQTILDEILVSVEISLLQDNMYTGEDSPREFFIHDISTSSNNHTRDKLKRNGELSRLDVTVIRLSNDEHKNSSKNCTKSFCGLGCICDSIHSSFHLKNHCGLVECMFECKCDFSKYNLNEAFEDDIIPGILNIDKENNLKLSKEEQKFHQTVVLSGEKSILLKSQKRNWKAPKRYADFYSSMCLKTKKEIKQILSVVEIKLNCTNVEPWCMVHNLYKCFCKGKFTEKLSENVSCDPLKTTDDSINNTKLPEPDSLKQVSLLNTEDSIVKNNLRPRRHQNIESERKVSTDAVNSYATNSNNFEKCARTKAYRGRKYSNIHYSNANKKIKEMERNDASLRKRMRSILNINEISDNKKISVEDFSESDNIPTIDLSAPVDCSDLQSITVEETKPPNERIVKSTKISKNSMTNNDSQIITDEFTTESSQTTESLQTTTDFRNKKLKSWLEPILKNYRQRFSNGFFKKSLDPPKYGKVALYPWDFIMERYKEKKNFFLVTRKKPFRIFMAINNRNALFDNCINISEINDVEKYPISVRNLINNEIDCLNEHLCILRGLDFCWELVGSVKRVCEFNKHLQNHSNQTTDTNESLSQIHTACNVTPETLDGDLSLKISETNKEQSKWFVMTLENDFSEIQFYNRGFFVKYDSIIKAINVARVSEKTVRLSSQKCSDGNGDPQFGIYAIPNSNEYCVFIGPYEKNEPLGIETVKTTSSCKKNSTRGVWITTNKIDNVRVIDNPLSFMSQINLEDEQVVVDSSLENNVESRHESTIPSPPKVPKIAPKPIKITKTNSFYHLTSSGLLKQVPVSPEKQNLIFKSPLLINKRLPLDVDTNITKWPLLCKGSPLTIQPNKTTKTAAKTKTYGEKNTVLSSNKPIAEIAPQVKVIDDITSKSEQGTVPSKKRSSGMSILKPEEINERSLVNKIVISPNNMCNITTTDATENMEMHMDIENFLANSAECSAPSADIYVISDEEDYCNMENNFNDVGIVCNNIDNIGWIPGRQNANKHLSFEFPGFKYTEFYPEEEALEKVNQVLSRKIYVSKSLHLTWSVMETKDLKDKSRLKQEDLGQDYVLTKRGLLHKSELEGRLKSKNKMEHFSSTTLPRPSKIQDSKTEMLLNKVNINMLETESNLLDEETNKLFGQLKDSNSRIVIMSNDARQEISERLRSIISNSDS